MPEPVSRRLKVTITVLLLVYLAAMLFNAVRDPQACVIGFQAYEREVCDERMADEVRTQQAYP